MTKNLVILAGALAWIGLFSACAAQPATEPAKGLTTQPALPAATTAAPPSPTEPSPTITTAPPTATALPGLGPGDSIGTLALLKGSSAPPIWAFCSPAFPESPGVKSQACRTPLLPELAIGHGWFSADESLRDETWKAMSWELYLDGKAVDLQAFGAIDADLPQTGLDKQDPDKEVITKLRTWDVTLSNLAVGAHSLRSILHVSQPIDDGFHITQPGTYELVSRFTVYSPPTPTLEVTKVIATQPEDIAGIWTTRYNPVGGPAYIQYKADGTWAIAKTVEKLKAPAQKGTFRFEGDRFITWDNECGEGEYTVQVLLFEGKPVGLAFSRLADACRDRVRDLTKPMSWVEP